MEDVFHGDTGDSRVIEAAIRLGDWITQQDGVSLEQREIIQRVQDALRQYPKVIRGLNAEYGFELTDNRYLEWERSEDAVKHFNDSDVSKPPETVNYGYCVSYFATNDPEKSTCIEIFKNVYVSPSLESIGWDEHAELFNRIVTKENREFSIYINSEPYKSPLGEQKILDWFNRKAGIAHELDTRARVIPEGFTLEWDISQAKG